MNDKSYISLVWHAIFGVTVKFSLAPNFRDLLTFGDLINMKSNLGGLSCTRGPPQPKDYMIERC